MAGPRATVVAATGAAAYPAGYVPGAASIAVVDVSSSSNGDVKSSLSSIATRPATRTAVSGPERVERRQPRIDTPQIPTVDHDHATTSNQESADPHRAAVLQRRRERREAKRLRRRPLAMSAGGETWQDPTLAGWDPHDFRLFVGNIGPEVDDEVLLAAFSHFPSAQRARAVHSSRLRGEKSVKGYGFVSFTDATDLARALREMDGKYVGNRPVMLRKAKWQERVAPKT